MTGRTISHYRILESIGAGGMGVVFKAEDTRLGRLVAIKMLPDELARDREALARFQREARTTSALNHPNICTIYEVDEAEGRPFLVMELLEGRTLQNFGPIERDKLLDLAIEFSDALATAHDAHVVHRDLKPANLFLTKLGHLKILDFGLAKRTTDPRGDSSRMATAARDLTASDTTLGTVSYMSPEQARGEDLDARTDLFSFGAVLYEMATGTRAFSGSTTAMIYDAILHREPVPLGRNQASLEPIVMKALQKDRELRYQSAADIRADLKRLRHDSAPATVQSQTLAPRSTRATGIVFGAAILAILAGVTFWRTRTDPVRTEKKQTTIAVLPFANLGAAKERDYLRLAVPDELITILSHSPALAVRPFAMTRKYAGDADPQQAGNALRVANIITGDYRESAGRIGLSVEAIDVEKNDVVWRDSLDVPAGDLIAMRNDLANRIRTGLLPRLNIAPAPESNHPGNDEAYGLFLRAAALSNDVQPNFEAIPLLERAVQLDPNYAPAWSMLSTRYYFAFQYGLRGPAYRQKSLDAAHRALALDPNLMVTQRSLIVLNTESGDLTGAYTQALDLLRRRPESGEAHFALSYVLRYAGVLDEAVRECETARVLDPTNAGFRSCYITFKYLNDAARAEQFITLDPNSEWTRARRGDTLVFQRRFAEAMQYGDLRLARWKLVDGVMKHAPESELARLTEEVKQNALQTLDGEPLFGTAQFFAAVGRPRDAFECLRIAIERNFCSYPAMERVPSLASLRSMPEYPAIRQAGMQCQQRFLDWRARNAP